MELSRQERVLRVLKDVRPGEGTSALVLFANVFLVLCAYYFIKPLREGWLAVEDLGDLSKVELKAYSAFGQSLVLLGVIGAYARLSSRLERGALITRATLFCMFNMLLFWLIRPGMLFDNLRFSGIAFYLWVGMFGVFVVAQAWTFVADVYTDEQGRRLVPMIAIGATSGAAVGSWIVGRLVAAREAGGAGLDPGTLLLLGTLPLGASILLTRTANRRASLGQGLAYTAEPAAPPSDESKRGGVGIVLSTPFLLMVALITVLMNWVNTNGENLLFRVVLEHLGRDALEQGIAGAEVTRRFIEQGTTTFYGDFFFWVNVAALLLQSLVASRLLKYGGFAAILLLLPVVAMISYVSMALVPVLAIVKAMKIAENATDYSINNTARHVLWLPVSSEMKFKGKPTIDTLFVRMGDGLAALTVVIGDRILSLATESFFFFNVALVAAWLVLALDVVRRHRRISERSRLHAS